MSKTEKTSNKSTLASNEDQINSRRKALKSMLAASGVVAGSQALSSEWTRPLVESVVLPAHAQTSDTASTYDSGLVGVGLLSTHPWYAKSNLLDSLISPAQAGSYSIGVRNSTCGSGQDIATDGGGYRVMFKVDGSNVDVCVSSEGNIYESYQRCTQQVTATLSGQNISDVIVVMDDSIDDPDYQEVVNLTGLAVNEALNMITGTLAVTAGTENTGQPPSCSGDFTSDLTAAVYDCSAAGTCQDEGSLTDE